MRLVDKQPVHSQLLKGHNIVLAPLRLELFQSGLQGFPGAFQLLDGKTLPTAGFHLCDSICNLVDLLVEEPFLAFPADGNTLKLAVSNDDSVIISGGDTGAELLTVMGLKVFFGGHKDIGGWVKPQKLRCPLLGQVVRHDKKGLLAQPQPLGFHSGGHHLERLSRTHFVRQQRIAAVEDMGNSAQLMLPQGDGRVHSSKSDMAAIVFTGPGGVHFFIVLAHQRLPPFRVLPNPIPKGIPDRLLLLRCQGGLLGIQHPALSAVCILHRVIDTNITEVQRIFQQPIGVGPVCTISGISSYIVVRNGAFAGDLPLSGIGCVIDLNTALEIKRGVKGLIHKLLDVLFVDPGSAQANLNLRSIQILGLSLFQRLHIDRKGGVFFCRPLCLPQLSAHIAGKVFIGSHIMRAFPLRYRTGQTENNAAKLSGQLVPGLAGQLFHVRHIHMGFFRNRDSQGFTCRVHGGHSLMGFDGALGEHIRLALQLSFLVNDFQRAQQIVAGIIGKGQTVSTVIDKAIPGREIIIKLVKLRLFLSDGAVWNGSIHLKVNEILNTIPQTDHAFYTDFGGGIEIRPHHAAVFPEVHFAVHHSIGVVFYIGVSGDRGVDGFALAQLRQRSLLIGATNILYSIVQLVGQFQALNGGYGVVYAMSGAFRFLSAQHHFRVVEEIAIDGKPIFRLTGLRPFRCNVQRTVSLLQKDNVRNHFGSGIGLERIVG